MVRGQNDQKRVIFGVIFETPKIIIFPLGAPVKSQKVGQKGVKKGGQNRPKMAQKWPLLDPFLWHSLLKNAKLTALITRRTQIQGVQNRPKVIKIYYSILGYFWSQKWHFLTPLKSEVSKKPPENNREGPKRGQKRGVKNDPKMAILAKNDPKSALF